jgi:hypothetical protein
MAIFQFAAPILPGKLDQWKAFSAEMSGQRKPQMDAIQAGTGVTRQVVSLQQTPMGDFAVVMIEGDDPSVFMGAMSRANDEFARWFKTQIMECHGMDLGGPMPETEVFYTYGE